MRVAVIVPRYGTDVLGGAETQAREFAEAATKRGWGVEVWTTCARSHYNWENTYPAGIEQCNDIVVWRFPITHWNPSRYADMEMRLALRGELSPGEAYQWLETGAHSAPLYAHVARCGSEFDVLVVLPYAMPMVHYATWAYPEKAVLWPCLHNEPYAYLEPTRLLLEGVWGVMFNTPEEQHLAVSRLGIKPHRFAVLGEGVTLAQPMGQSPWKNSTIPTLLYVGRLEEGKNLPLLYEYVRKYSDQKGSIRLAIMGDGPYLPPRHPAFERLGVVSEEEKASAYAAALALCQPSLRESFSRTVMESWLAGRPVLVHEDCPVTRGHVQRSKGGLWFRTYEEFAGALDWLLEHPDLASRMGENGRRYVLANYTWETVLDRFEALIHQWKAEK